MKIVAQMEPGKYLTEISSRELHELNADIKIQIGAEYDISRAAETLVALRSLNKNKLAYIKRQIDELQKKFNEIEESYDAVMMLDNVKNSEEK
jgi:hypothetical protein